MANQDITDDDPYSRDQLGTYFDPFIYEHIKELKLDGVNINNFVIVFWDIMFIRFVILFLLPTHDSVKL